jgi:PAS domain S-box-containing protein/putative nucleotidyltransferase with HDIG domain
MGPDLNQRSVLLVEDNPGDARLIAESHRDAGGVVRLTTVETLAAALSTLASDRLDAVILDLGLPDSQGLETFERLQAAFPDIATIIMSGDSDTRTALQAVQDGAQDFLIKGRADSDTLVRSIGYAIERKLADAKLLSTSERLRRNLLVSESVAELARILVAQPETIEEMANLVLERAMALTDSRHGYVSMIDPATGAHVMLAATEMLPGSLLPLTDAARSQGFPPPVAGLYPHIWGISLNTARPFLTNDPAAEPLRGGAPSEHIALECYLSAPVLSVDGVIGQVAVANAPDGYAAEDALILERLASLYAVAIVQSAEHESLRRSEEDLRTAQATARIGSYAWDIATGFWTSSETMDEIFGIDGSYVRDLEGWTNLVHEDDREMMARYVAEDVVGRGRPFDKQYRVTRRSDGVTEWVHGRGAVEKASDGTPLRLIGVIQDVTSQHQSEQEVLATNANLQRMIRDVAEVMGGIIETRDPYTQGHQVRVASIAVALATEMGLSGDDLDCIQMAALLHDVGKLSVPSEILSKPGQLSDVEFALIREHPVRGHAILSRIAFPWPIADIVLQHHERCDGSGYPAGLHGGEILRPASILAVADVLEAMASYRPYRASLGPEAAIAEVADHPDKYCADVVQAAVALYDRAELGI